MQATIMSGVLSKSRPQDKRRFAHNFSPRRDLQLQTRSWGGIDDDKEERKVIESIQIEREHQFDLAECNARDFTASCDLFFAA